MPKRVSKMWFIFQSSGEICEKTIEAQMNEEQINLENVSALKTGKSYEVTLSSTQIISMLAQSK